MKQIISEILLKALKKQNLNFKKQEIINLIEIPPSQKMGDYAIPCFFLSKKLKKNPAEIADNFSKNLQPTKQLEKIESNGPYLNFFINKKYLSEATIKQVLKQKNNYGKNSESSKKTMIEFASPNTNKPLHLGHLRNMAIGESISRILEFNGENVIRTSINNDRGVHICKSMLAYKTNGKLKTPKSENKKSDHFVGDYYILFNTLSNKNKSLELQAQELLQKWEKGDKKTISLWKKMRKWALDGFHETYKKFGIKFDHEFFESEIYTKGKEIVLQGLKNKIFQKRKDGAIFINLEKERLGDKVLLRPNGTSVYMTQDLYLAKLKQQKFKIDKSIYVVGVEQNYHFDVLFAILKKLKYKIADQLKHLSYGMVRLPEGKMKSREGTVVDADDLIKKVQDLVKTELSSREKLFKKELEKRSLEIALASIKYMLLKVDIKKSMLFNPKESINFEGDTGPYILYSYARASSILQKLKNKKGKLSIKELSNNEIKLVKKISEFPKTVYQAYSSMNPALIANYSYQLAQTFNEFYHTCQVIGSKQEIFRIKLIQSFRQTLKNSLHLLGINVIERM